MAEQQGARRVRAPWHLWVIGIFGLLWNAMGAMDYLMTQTKNEKYMSAFTPEQLEFFYGLPAWVVSAWAIAVWVLLASFIAMVITSFHNFFLSNGMEVMGDPVTLTFTAAIFLIALALYLYARAMQKRAVL